MKKPLVEGKDPTYSWEQASVAFRYTLGEGLVCMEAFPTQGRKRIKCNDRYYVPGLISMSFGDLSTSLKLKFEDHVHGKLMVGGMSMEAFSFRVSAYYIVNELVGVDKDSKCLGQCLSLNKEIRQSPAFNNPLVVSRTNDNGLYYKLSMKEVPKTILEKDRVILGVNLVHDSGLRLPFRHNRSFYISLRRECNLIKQGPHRGQIGVKQGDTSYLTHG
ncbi:hypothetical protein OAT16_07820 [Prolixibacteraceae bacterium]|nr:hypothetical protein [Prolixibacteraceae bacterium]